MNNKPTMFVNTIFYGNPTCENQVYYDSRKYVKCKVFHRIDDIKSFMYLGKRVYVKIASKLNLFEGYVIFLDNKTIQIKYNDKIYLIYIADVDEIKILNVL